MQINRLFEIVYMLLDGKVTTAKELAEHFEVSVRTIYRDIDTLSSAGIPIYATQGKGGGITLLDEYILNKSVLSEREQNEILFALQSLTVAQNPETDKVLSKLSSLFNKNKINWIEVDFSPWGSSENHKCQFNALKNAIINRQVIEFEYFNTSGEKSSRKVEPVKLIFKVNAWYLQGFCLSQKAYRTFKISRMSDVRITPETFIEKPPEEMPEETQKQKTGNWIELQLKVSPEGAYRVFDEFDEKEIVKNRDGSFTIATALPESEWLFNYVLSFGTTAEVISPPIIRKILQNKLEEITKKYKNK